MKSYKELYEKLEKIAYEKLPEKKYPGVAEEIMKKLIIRNYTKTGEKKQVSRPKLETAWEDLTLPSQDERYSHINQLTYGLNKNLKKGEFRFIVSWNISNGNIKNKITSVELGNRTLKIDKDKNVLQYFLPVSMVNKDGKEKALPNVLGNYKEPLIWATISQSEKMYSAPCTRVKTSEGKEYSSTGLIGMFDNNLGTFHRRYGRNVQNLMAQCLVVGPVETFEKALNKYIDEIRNGDEKPAPYIVIEPRNFKLALARCIALIERVPIAAVYASSAQLSTQVFQDAFVRGIKSAVGENFSFEKVKVNEWIEETKQEIIITLAEKIKKSSLNSLALPNKNALMDNFELLDRSIKNQVTLEDIAEELEQARADIEKAFEREDAPAFKRTGAAPKNPMFNAAFDDEEDEEEESIPDIPEDEDEIENIKKKSPSKPAPKKADPEETVEYEDDDDDDEEFPF